MAVTNAAALDGLDEFHFEPAQFDALLEQNGTPAELRLATRCSCWEARSGQPDPACAQCYPFGYLYEAPDATKVHGPSRRGMLKLIEAGIAQLGDAMFTFKPGIVPSHGTRLVLPRSRVRESDTLTKGKEDTIRWSRVLAVEAGHYTRRVPPSGSPYVTETVPLVLDGPSPDITITDRRVTWNNAAIPDGTRYVLRILTNTEFCVWDLQDRHEGGNEQPYRALGKRLDFLLHERDGKAARI